MTATASREPALKFIFVTMVLSVLGFGLFIPVLPGVVKGFQHGDEAAGSHMYGVLVGVYAALQFVGSPILGALSDRFGRRRVILIALAGSSIDYVIMALATSVLVSGTANAASLALGMTWLFIARVISGFTAGVMATANAYVADVMPPEKRAHGFGILGAAFGIGFIIGPLLGGFLGGISLQLPFWFAAGCSMLNWIYGYFVLPESLKPENRRAFEWKRANPIGALKVLGRFPAVRGVADAYFMLMLSQTVLYSTWVLCMQYRYHWTTGQVGTSLGIAGVMSAIVQATLVKKIVPKLGDSRAVITGLSITIFALICYGLAPVGWMIYLIIPIGAFGGMAGPAVQSYITKHVPANEQGAVQGIFGGLASLAGIPGPLIGTWSFGWAVGHGMPAWLAGIAFFEGALIVTLALMLVIRTFAADATRTHGTAPTTGAAV